MGKKLNPSLVKICDIKDTSYDPLAKSIRKYFKDHLLSEGREVVWNRRYPIKGVFIVGWHYMVLFY